MISEDKDTVVSDDMKDLNRARDKNENDAFTHYFIGNIWFDKKKYNEALKSYNEALKSYNEALKSYDNADAINLDYIEAYYKRSYCLYYFNDFKNALNDINKCIELNPNNINIYYALRFLCLFALQDFQNCLSELNKFNIKEPCLYLLRSCCFFILNDYKKALEDIDKYLELENKNFIEPYVFLMKAFCLALSNDFKNAISNMNKYIELGGYFGFNRYFDVYFYRDYYLFIFLNDIEQSFNNIEKRIELNPNHDVPYFMKALFLILSNDFENALINLNICITINPNSAFMYFVRALCLLTLGDIEKAFFNINECIKLNPTYVDLLKIFQLLLKNDFESALAYSDKYIELNLNYLLKSFYSILKNDFVSALHYIDKYLNSDKYLGLDKYLEVNMLFESFAYRLDKFTEELIFRSIYLLRTFLLSKSKDSKDNSIDKKRDLKSNGLSTSLNSINPISINEIIKSLITEDFWPEVMKATVVKKVK